MKRKTKSPTIDSAEFVRVWQRSNTATEAAAQLGITVRAASWRAWWLRSHGVSLKTMRGGRARTNFSALDAVARRHEP